jgi:diacylglycerol kinase (ATP)
MWGVVINPISGRGKGARLGSHTTAFLDRHGIHYKIITGASAELTRNNLSEFTSQGNCEGVIAVGGDGLANLVIQNLATTNIPMAIIPAGTGNDFCRALGWSIDDVDEILTRTLTSAPLPIDLGLVGDSWFGAILSTGFDSLVNERANSMKWPSGPMKYNLAMLLELFGFRARSYQIDVDGQHIDARAMLIAIGNGSSYGGGMKVCPNADIEDGFFDIMVLEPISIFNFLRVFPRVYKGTHITHPAVTIYRGKTLTITAEAIAYADGERVGPLPISAKCVSAALYTWLK